MNRRSFLSSLLTLGAGIVVVGPSVLADVHRYVPVPVPSPWDDLTNISAAYVKHQASFVSGKLFPYRPNVMLIGSESWKRLKRSPELREYLGVHG